MMAFTLNGVKQQTEVAEDTPLLWVLREQLTLIDTKFDCGVAQYSACTAHVEGVAVQPRNVAAQIQGGIVYGLGHVLREEITIRNGRVEQSNFGDYQVIRMEDVPNVEVAVVSTDNPPTGAGEDGLPLVACAVGNAIAKLTGVRLRELPFAPERVRGALGA